MSQCPKCSTPREAGDRFCGKCGERLVEAESGDDAALTQQSLRLSDVHYNLGMVYYKKGDYAKALEAWEKGIGQDPDNAVLKQSIQDVQQKLASPD